MGAFIAQQPNGLYCRFSTIVDCPTHWDMTEEEYINLKVEMAIENAKREAKSILSKHLRPFDEVEERFIDNNMTKEEFEQLLKEMGKEV